MDVASRPGVGTARPVSGCWLRHRPARPARSKIRRRAASTGCSFIPKWCIPRRACASWRISSSAFADARRTGIRRAHRVDRRPDSRAGRRPQGIFLCQRRRRFDGGFHACACEALGSERVRGVYVDTGLMREGETEFVRQTFAGWGWCGEIEQCEEEFLAPLERRARSGTEAPHHRRAVREGAGADYREPRAARTAAGFWGRARFIRIPSNRAARRKRPPSRRITTACRVFRS